MKKTVKLISSVAVCSLLFFSCEKEAIDSSIGSEETESSVNIGAVHAISGEYIVVYNEDTSIAGKSIKMQEKTKLTLSKHGIKSNDLKSVYSAAIQGFSVKNISEKQLQLLKNDSEIAYVEPNFVRKLNYRMVGVPMSKIGAKSENKADDDGYTLLENGEWLPWGIRNVGRKSGKGKRCWIIDTGIALHDDLDIDKGRSKNFVAGEDSWKDEDGHGTHVAGTVAAINNGDGVLGVAPGAKVVAVRVLDDNGEGTDDAILGGLDYVTKNIKKGDTWNYSIGFDGRATSKAYDDAMRALGKKAKGAMAAGNENDNTKYYSPQRIQNGNTFVVGAFDRKGNATGFSNFGKSVDFWAPGKQVLSTYLKNEWAFLQGTSMASPHVAGILLVNNGKVGQNGNVKKKGHVAPKAKLK